MLQIQMLQCLKENMVVLVKSHCFYRVLAATLWGCVEMELMIVGYVIFFLQMTWV